MSDLIFFGVAFALGVFVGGLWMNEVWYRHSRSTHESTFAAWQQQITDHYRDFHGPSA